MKNSLILVALSAEQISEAKAVNRQRKQIPHALLCGSYGQLFGAEKQCSKYYNVWKDTFQDLFSESKTVQAFDVINYGSTSNLVNILIVAADQKKQVNNCIKPTKSQKPEPTEKKGFGHVSLGRLITSCLRVTLNAWHFTMRSPQSLRYLHQLWHFVPQIISRRHVYARISTKA